MATYPQATTLTRPNLTSTDRFVHFVSNSAADLEARVNAELVTIRAAADFVGGMHLAGSGDGNTFAFMMMVMLASSGGALAGAPANVDGAGTKVFFCQAATPAELQVALYAMRARIADWLNEGAGAAHTAVYTDMQMAGSGAGQQCMAMGVVVRAAINQ